MNDNLGSYLVLNNTRYQGVTSMKEILSLAEACEFLRIAKPTLYRYVRNGEVPAFKVGKAWRFHKESLEKWVGDQIIESTAARKEYSR